MFLLSGRTGLFVSALVTATAISAEPADAGCPFGPPPTLSQWYHSADTFLFVRRLESGEFEVLDVAKAPSGTSLKKGSRFKAKSLREKPSEFGMAFGFENEAIVFDGQPFTKPQFDYLRKTPDLELPHVERMKYFAAFLNSADEMIAEDACRELDLSLPRELPAVAKLLPADTLRAWIKDPTTAERAGALARLLGFVGNADDSTWMKERILAPANGEIDLGTPGLMTGYLLLAGAAGLDVLDEKKLGPRDTNFHELYAGMTAIDFVGNLEDKPIPRDRLVRSLYLLLDRLSLADLVIIRLARWKDWSVQDRLVTMYDEEEFKGPITRRSIIRYMMAWETMLLPFVDQAVLYNKIDFRGMPQKPDKTLLTSVPQYLCPADATPDPNPLHGGFATSNYVGNYGDKPFQVWLPVGQSDSWPGGMEAPMKSTGLFARNSSVRIRDITDGTSNTIMAGERSHSSGGAIWAGVTDNGRPDDVLSDTSHRSRPQTGPSSFSSPHGGNVMVVLIDGAVRSVDVKIDSKPAPDKGVWQRLGNKSDGQVVGEF